MTRTPTPSPSMFRLYDAGSALSLCPASNQQMAPALPPAYDGGEKHHNSIEQGGLCKLVSKVEGVIGVPAVRVCVPKLP
jgi:hypothetical protein